MQLKGIKLIDNDKNTLVPSPIAFKEMVMVC